MVSDIPKLHIITFFGTLLFDERVTVYIGWRFSQVISNMIDHVGFYCEIK